ncbi:sigma24 [Litoreibacter arenae DSM 19593]|uniref:Sigma24 n=2 Tax=Litoreibacter TaxID=947567 RepID=S9QLN1_9RHOB|nr:sigma24 [Litoreibacter arenae DSM 19593]
MRPTITMRMKTSDEALAQAASDGDSEAFGLLARRHYDRLFRLSWRLTGHKADAEDLTHDILAALPAKLRSFRSDARFTTWLYRVTLNAATDRARKAQRRRAAREGWGQDYTRRAAEAADAAQAQDWLTTAMRALPAELRETVALTLGEDLTQAQAAEVMGLSEGTIAWRMSEVKRHLREMATEEAG